MNMDITIPDAVFFDWDGTLADTYNFLNDAHGSILASLGFPPFKDGEYKQYFGMPREILYPKIYQNRHEEAKALFESYVLENGHKIMPLKGAKGILDYFKNYSVPLGIVSNKKANFIHREIKNFGWEEYFSVIIGAGEAKKDKPSGEPLLYGLEKLSLHPKTHNIWYVGDTENDLSCAKEAGSSAIYIKGHEAPEPLIQKYSPLIYAENCTQLHEILVAIHTKTSKTGE